MTSAEEFDQEAFDLDLAHYFAFCAEATLAEDMLVSCESNGPCDRVPHWRKRKRVMFKKALAARRQVIAKHNQQLRYDDGHFCHVYV